MTTARGEEQEARGVDPRVPRFGQAITGIGLVVAFATVTEPLVVILAAILLAATLGGPRWNVWSHLFGRVVRPAFRLAPPEHLKDGAPPRFASLLGATFLGVSSVLLYVGFPFLGWVAALLVSALALLAAVTDICVGCEFYGLWLRVRAARAG
ncbi:MAG: DUF4395 domain-containing protein [Methanobacteriota archaeon]